MLAAVVYESGEAGDLLLTEVADALTGQGLRLAGMVQANRPAPERCACAMSLRDLASGREIPISQDLGREARGCRLDAAALEEAAGLIEASLAEAPELLILNKFGKREAEGGGFRAAIAKAVEAGIPVLIGVNGANLPAWEAFAERDALMLPGERGAILDWAGRAVSGRRVAA